MKRIQRKRSKGWRMPSNAVYVGRPTKFGNPFAVTFFRSREEAVAEYRSWLERVMKKAPSFLDELKGKDLACWCPLDKACHADVILEMLEEKQ